MLVLTLALITDFSPEEKGNIFPLLGGLFALAFIQSRVGAAKTQKQKFRKQKW